MMTCVGLIRYDDLDRMKRGIFSAILFIITYLVIKFIEKTTNLKKFSYVYNIVFFINLAMCDYTVYT